MFLAAIWSSLCFSCSMYRFIPPLVVLAPHDSNVYVAVYAQVLLIILRVLYAIVRLSSGLIQLARLAEPIHDKHFKFLLSRLVFQDFSKLREAFSKRDWVIIDCRQHSNLVVRILLLPEGRKKRDPGNKAGKIPQMNTNFISVTDEVILQSQDIMILKGTTFSLRLALSMAYICLELFCYL